jgi:hypothetical protein
MTPPIMALTPESLAAYALVLIATDHSCLDYDFILRHAPLVVDNAILGGNDSFKLVRA